MGMLSRVVCAVAPSLGLILACSSPSEKDPVIPAGGGSSNTSGTNSGGSSGASTGGSTSGAGGAAACSEECKNGTVCKEGACVCPVNKAMCGGACVPKDDPMNCGACGTVCDPGAACAPTGCTAKPTEIWSGTGCGSIRMVLAGTKLYWAENTSGKIMSLDLAAATTPPVELAIGQLKPTGIATDATGVYWVNEGDGTPGSSKVMKKALPIAAGAPVTLATGTATAPDSDVIRAIAVSKGKVLYTLVHDVHAVSTDEAVTADVIVGTATDKDLDPPKPAGLPSGLAVTGDYVAWTTDQRQAIERDDLTEGGAAYAELGESQGMLLLRDLGTDGTNLYWASAEALRLCPLAKEDGPGNTFLTATKDFDAITAFAISAEAAYFAGDKGLVFTDSLTVADPAVPATPLARDQKGVSSMLVAGQELIWATSECKIMSAALSGGIAPL